jgi:hypothetical protein
VVVVDIVPALLPVIPSCWEYPVPVERFDRVRLAIVRPLEPVAGSYWAKLARQFWRSCGSAIGPHSRPIRDCRKPGLVSSNLSYCALSALLRAGFPPQLLRTCAWAAGTANTIAHPAASARLVTVFFVMTVQLLLEDGHEIKQETFARGSRENWRSGEQIKRFSIACKLSFELI